MASRSQDTWAEPRTSRRLKQVAPHPAVRNVTGRAPMAITQCYGRPAPALAGADLSSALRIFLNFLDACVCQVTPYVQYVRGKKTRS